MFDDGQVRRIGDVHQIETADSCHDESVAACSTSERVSTGISVYIKNHGILEITHINGCETDSSIHVEDVSLADHVRYESFQIMDSTDSDGFCRIRHVKKTHSGFRCRVAIGDIEDIVLDVQPVCRSTGWRNV